MRYGSNEDIIASLIEARKAKNLTQTELGKRLGLPQSYISKLESGRVDARMSSIIEIARFLNLELLLIPANMAPTVSSLVGSGKERTADSPLYTLHDLESDDDK